MTIELAKNLAVIAGATVAVITFILALIQYRKNVALKRAEHFDTFRVRRENNPLFHKLSALLEVDDPKLAELPWDEKIEVLGFYEDIALMVNSGLMKKHVAHYMFSYYAIRISESEHFWNDVEKESIYWSLFWSFVKDMKDLESKFRYKKRNYKL